MSLYINFIVFRLVVGKGRQAAEPQQAVPSTKWHGSFPVHPPQSSNDLPDEIREAKTVFSLQ